MAYNFWRVPVGMGLTIQNAYCMDNLKPEVICICGSTRFSDLMAVLGWEFEKMGKIVLKPNYLPQWYIVRSDLKENYHVADQQGLKEVLDELHCRKIDLCDKVYVCNQQSGYIGESTANEIAYAEKIGKPVLYLEMHGKNEFSEIADEMARWWCHVCE